jgi:hypothetical protein
MTRVIIHNYLLKAQDSQYEIKLVDGPGAGRRLPVKIGSGEPSAAEIDAAVYNAGYNVAIPSQQWAYLLYENGKDISDDR